MKKMRVYLSSLSVEPIFGEGCNNTFLIFDCLDGQDEIQVIREAHSLLIKSGRDDALILVKEFEDEEKLVLKMIVLEPDGSLAEFCGNGARVVACYLKKLFGEMPRKYYLQTTHRRCRLWWEDDNYFVHMGRTTFKSLKCDFFNSPLETFKLGLGLNTYNFYWTETMEPHLVTFDPIKESELMQLGLYINHSQRNYFPLGVNLNSASLTDLGLNVVTFERGVNRITSACGTGATSSASLAKEVSLLSESNIPVVMKGGSIMIKIKDKLGAIMSGPASLG